MHQTVLNRDVQKESRIWNLVERRVESGADTIPIGIHPLGARPMFRGVRRHFPVNGVDAESEQSIQLGIGTGQIARPAQKIPVKRFEMAAVEDDAMAFGNGAIVDGFALNDPEERICFRSCVKEPADQRLAVIGNSFLDCHSQFFSSGFSSPSTVGISSETVG